MSSSPPLTGRTALVTGVSRRRGIGFAVARQLASLGASIFLHHYRPHDLDQPWGGDDVDAVRAGVADALHAGARLGDLSADLVQDGEPDRLLEAAVGLTGRLDVLVCNHAKSGDDGGVLDMTAARLDAFWRANTRSTLELTAGFARLKAAHDGTSTDAVGPTDASSLTDRDTDDATPARRPGERGAPRGPFAEPTGRVIWMTSGQHLGPMRGEVAYATSKAALAGVTATVAAELLELGVVLNTVNPGPVNTGYLDPETTDRPLEDLQAMIAATPFGRYGAPQDVAELIGWLVSDRGAWVVGQVLTSDGGFSLG